MQETTILWQLFLLSYMLTCVLSQSAFLSPGREIDQISTRGQLISPNGRFSLRLEGSISGAVSLVLRTIEEDRVHGLVVWTHPFRLESDAMEPGSYTLNNERDGTIQLFYGSTRTPVRGDCGVFFRPSEDGVVSVLQLMDDSNVRVIDGRNDRVLWERPMKNQLLPDASLNSAVTLVSESRRVILLVEHQATGCGLYVREMATLALIWTSGVFEATLPCHIRNSNNAPLALADANQKRLYTLSESSSPKILTLFDDGFWSVTDEHGAWVGERPQVDPCAGGVDHIVSTFIDEDETLTLLMSDYQAMVAASISTTFSSPDSLQYHFHVQNAAKSVITALVIGTAGWIHALLGLSLSLIWNLWPEEGDNYDHCNSRPNCRLDR